MKMTRKSFVSLLVILTSISCKAGIVRIENAAFTLEVSTSDNAVHVKLYDKNLDTYWSNESAVYKAIQRVCNVPVEFGSLENTTVKKINNSIYIKGTIADLDFEQTLTLPPNQLYLNETMTLRNNTGQRISLSGFEARMQVKVTDNNNNVLDLFSSDHLMAIPFLHRATDSKGVLHDYSIAHILTEKGFVFAINEGSWEYQRRIPSEHYIADAWAWIHGKGALCIFSYNQENLMFSFVTGERKNNASYLKFGGVYKDSVALTALERIEPGQTLNLGMTRYQPIASTAYNDCAYAYRAMLDELGCRFPSDYNPPVQWNQLYNMPDTWKDRSIYTRSSILKEAQKAREHSCQALYLDPGWDTSFGSFMWGTERLGSYKDFIRTIKHEYNLDIALHCPTPPWASNEILAWKPCSVNEWPKQTRRMLPLTAKVSESKEGKRNLALLKSASASASSAIEGHSIHKTEHLNDGYYGNEHSWIAKEPTSWAQIDLGDIYQIDTICLSNDFVGNFSDRSPVNYNVLIGNDEAFENNCHSIASIKNEPLKKLREFTFQPAKARYIRVIITATEGNACPRLDEIQVFEAIPSVDRNDAPPTIKLAPALSGPQICMGSKLYLDEAQRRLESLCKEGVVFVMFDGTWWNGPCFDESHGHPIPYLFEDHIRSCVELAQRLHKKYPDVYIEMHDMLTGGHWLRATPVYYKYGLPGSYNENWAFELMWQPIENIQSGLATAMYYYNLACNIPLYLHINIGTDNQHCLSFWWYASTTRHLGIGGDNPDPEIVSSHKAAMKKYIKLEEFYKRGDFFGINEEIHIHALPHKNAFIVNCFNLSETEKTISGHIDLKTMGIDASCAYKSNSDWVRVENGILFVSHQLPAWGADLAEIYVLP